jgi:hypothetical protein
MRLLSTRAAPFLALIALALGACGDQTKLTQPAQDANFLRICDPDCPLPPPPPPPPPPAAVKSVSLPPGTLYIIGGSVSYSVSLQGGPTTLTNVSISSKISQPTGSLVVTSAWVSCGSSLGTLPSITTCTMPLTALVVGGGLGLVPGPATFEVDLVQGSTILSTKTLSVTIDNASPQVTGINAGASPLLISAGAKSFTATLFNPFGSRPDLIQVNGYIRQGSLRVWVGGQPVNCGSGLGVLPSGSCSTSSPYTLGGATLVPGPAIFEVDLVNGSNLLLDSTSVNVTLVGAPSIGAVTVSGAVIVGSPDPIPVTYTASIQNPGPLLSPVTIKDTIIQGSVRLAVGSQNVVCNGGAQGSLPNGSCTFAGTFAANDPGRTLVPGAATTLQVTLSDPVDGVLATQTVPITIAPPPQIDAVIMNSTTLVIDGPSVGYTAALSNPGPDLLRPLTLTTVLTQSGGVSRTVDSFAVKCANGSDGLPAGGSCSPASQLSVKSSGGTGVLTPGQPTSLVFQLIDTGSGKVLATFAQSVTLQ